MTVTNLFLLGWLATIPIRSLDFIDLLPRMNITTSPNLHPWLALWFMSMKIILFKNRQSGQKSGQRVECYKSGLLQFSSFLLFSIRISPSTPCLASWKSNFFLDNSKLALGQDKKPPRLRKEWAESKCRRYPIDIEISRFEVWGLRFGC